MNRRKQCYRTVRYRTHNTYGYTRYCTGTGPGIPRGTLLIKPTYVVYGVHRKFPPQTTIFCRTSVRNEKGAG